MRGVKAYYWVERFLAGARFTPSSDYVYRGICILLIVLGHNHFFRESYYPAYSALYIFHVQAFLILPFLRTERQATSGPPGGHVARYYTPFFVFVTLYFAIFCAYSFQDATPSEWLRRYARAITVANSATLNEATGFEMFWFLPVFILLMIAREKWSGARIRGRALMLAVAAAAHLFGAPLLLADVTLLPWGIPILLYMLLPCLIASFLSGSELATKSRILASGVVFALSLTMCIRWELRINLSDFRVYDISNPAALLLTDAVMISAALFIYGLSHRITSRALSLIGIYSLQIYLIHGIISYAAGLILTKMAIPVGFSIALGLGTTVALSLALSMMLLATPFGRSIFKVRRSAILASAVERHQVVPFPEQLTNTNSLRR